MFTRNYDVRETDTALELQFELSGYAPADISVSADTEQLTIEAKRKAWHGERHFARAFSLPDVIDRDAITASYDLGLLTVALPKRANATKRAIPILCAGNTG